MESIILDHTYTQLRRGVPVDIMVEVLLKLPKLISTLEDLHLFFPLPEPLFFFFLQILAHLTPTLHSDDNPDVTPSEKPSLTHLKHQTVLTIPSLNINVPS